MEIKAIPEIIKSMDQLIRQGKYDDAYEFGKNNIDLNKEYSEGEYSFKNILEEYIFKIFIKDEISKTCPLMLDYSALYSNFAMASIYENQYEDAERSVELSLKYNPVNVNALLAKAELSRIKNNWDDFYKLNIKAIKFSYESKNLVMAFKNLAIHYLNKDTGKEDNGDLLEENIKTAIYLARISGEYDKDSNKPVSELNYIKNKTDTISNENIKEKIAEFEKTDLNEIKEYLKSREIPYEASIEIITICKTLGFQLDETKKVVPALFYFQKAYDLSKDEAILDTIAILNEKIGRVEKSP